MTTPETARRLAVALQRIEGTKDALPSLARNLMRIATDSAKIDLADVAPAIATAGELETRLEALLLEAGHLHPAGE